MIEITSDTPASVVYKETITIKERINDFIFDHFPHIIRRGYDFLTDTLFRKSYWRNSVSRYRMRL
jgi:hypothetical protein